MRLLVLLMLSRDGHADVCMHVKLSLRPRIKLPSHRFGLRLMGASAFCLIIYWLRAWVHEGDASASWR